VGQFDRIKSIIYKVLYLLSVPILMDFLAPKAVLFMLRIQLWAAKMMRLRLQLLSLGLYNEKFEKSYTDPALQQEK
jgi:hypothetical protein